MKRVDDFRLRMGNKEYVPIMIGGMGVDISTSELALEAARLGGIGHISDAMSQDVSDRKFDTTYVKEKTKTYKFNINNMNKAVVQFDLITWPRPRAVMSARPWKRRKAMA